MREETKWDIIWEIFKEQIIKKIGESNYSSFILIVKSIKLDNKDPTN